MNLIKTVYYKLKRKYPAATLRVYIVISALLVKVKRIENIVQWFFNSGSVVKTKATGGNRLLLIYDLTYQPFSIGDFIVVQEAAMVQCERLKLAYADIAIVYNSEKPNKSKEFASINTENILFHLASFLPVAQVNKNIGSILIFDSHLQLERYITAGTQQYHIWPSGLSYAGGDYLYWKSLNGVISDFYFANGFIPAIQFKDFLTSWAMDFYKTKLDADIPVTVNIRNNPFFSTNRNSDLDAWLKFFNNCNGKYPAKFIIICAANEVDARLRLLPNVVIAKDFHTGIEKDLVLINTAAAHMGVPSGPFSISWFNNKPYRMFKSEEDSLKRYNDIIYEGDFFRFCFSNLNQRMTTLAETSELLENEFRSMWNGINKESYQKNKFSTLGTEGELSSWMR